MPGLPRLELPGVPAHVTQRGINRGTIFLDADDRYHFRRLLRRACRDHGIVLHAFVLMDNHFHLLVTPDVVGTAYCHRLDHSLPTELTSSGK